nr:hypothetical protein [Tanacetum cinerariifolium]
MELMKLMELCTKLSDKVHALENNKTAQDLEITHLKKRVKSINITTAEPVTTVSAPITTAGVSVSIAKPSTPPTTTTTVIEDKDLTTAQTLMKMRCEKSKEKAKERGSKEKSSETATRPTKGVIMREASETTTRPTVLPQQKLNPKDKDSFESMDPKVVKDRAEGNETRAKGSSKRAGEELESDKSKKQKLDEKVEAEVDNDQEEAEMKMYMKIVSDDEVAIDAIPLATKPLIIIDWKIIKEGKIRKQSDTLEAIFFMWSTFCEVSKSAYLYAGREKEVNEARGARDTLVVLHFGCHILKDLVALRYGIIVMN